MYAKVKTDLNGLHSQLNRLITVERLFLSSHENYLIILYIVS